MFLKKNEEGYRTPMEGIHYQTLSYGDKTLMAKFKLEKNNVLPDHEHPHEQTGLLISGRINLTIAGTLHEVHPGDSWCIPGGVEHRADIIEDSVAVEVFSPVREDFLP
jgi:quercetin dioxygenase-like cupin family protein